MSGQPELTAGTLPTDLESLFNTSEYFDIGAMDVTSPAKHSTIGVTPAALNPFGLGEPSAPFDRLETLSPNENLGGIATVLQQQQQNLHRQQAQAFLNSHAINGSGSAMEGIQLNGTNGNMGNGDMTGDDKSSQGL